MKSSIITAIALLLSFASYAIGPITGSTVLCTGGSTTLTDTTAGGTWTSSNTGVATVTSSGNVSAVSAGTVTIFYRVGADSVHLSLTVNHVPSEILGGSVLCTGSTVALSDGTGGGSWISGNTAFATVSSTGLVTGTSPGTTNIYYTIGSSSSGCSVFHPVTVNAPASISGASSVCTGATISLTGTPSGGSWISGNTTMGTVSATGDVTGVTGSVVAIYYTMGSTSSGCLAMHLVSVHASPAVSGASTICAGASTAFTASPAGGSWSSANTGIATVSSTGTVTGLSAGVTSISYYNGGCYGARTVTVNAAASISGPSAVCTGAPITLTGSPSGGSWISGNTTMATVGSTGIVTGITNSVVNIYYTMGTSTICVAEHLVSVRTAPAISGASTICAGASTTFTASPGGGTWMSGDSGIITITSTGIATGHAAGVTNIYYSNGGCPGFRTVTVNAAAAISGASVVCTGSTVTLTGTPSGGIWISSNTTMATVGSTGVVSGLTAGAVTIYYTMGTSTTCAATHLVSIHTSPSISGSSVICTGSTAAFTGSPAGGTWSVGGSGIATVSTTGVVTGLAAGVTNIYYTLGDCVAYRTVTVNAGASISGASLVCTGATITLTSTPSGGTWISGNTTMATVGSTGVVTGASAGVVNIYYTLGSTSSGCLAQHLVTIRTTPAISGASTVCTGSSTILSATAAGGTWSVSGSGIATVSASGVVTGLATGVATIYYTLGDCIGSRTVTVNAAASITGASTFCMGSTTTLTGSPSGGAWISGNTSIATINSTGVLTSITTGVVNVYYTFGTTITGCYATKALTVNPVAAAILGASSLCVGSHITLTDATPGGTWSVSSSGVATVSASGVVTGLSAGVTNIYYVTGGCGAYRIVTVNTAPAPIAGASMVCVGSSITLTDSISGGSWYSGNTTRATVSASGVVTGSSPGLVTIYYTLGSTLSDCIAAHIVTVNAAASVTGASTVCTGSSITLLGSPAGGTWSEGGSGIATVSASGVVTGLISGVTNIYYSVNGCSAYHTVTVNTAAAISGVTAVCTWATISLTGSPSGGFWVSGNTTMATVSSTGVVTGGTSGVVNIYYIVGSTSTGCVAEHLVTITAAPAISGASVVCTGSTVTLAGTPLGGTWSTSDSSIVGISTSGIVTGLTAGVANIYYSRGGCYASHPVTVNVGAVISGSSTVCTGATTTLTSSISGGTWISSNTGMATVSASGVVSGLTSGVVNIYYSLGSTSSGCHAEHLVTVRTAPAISGASTICMGSSISLSASPAGGSWSIGSSGIATVSTIGVVTGLSAGSATIYYFNGGCYSSHMVIVNLAGTITGGSVVCTGSTTTLTGSPTGGSWISGNTTMATVSSLGVVSGLTSGVVNIYYLLGGSTACAAEHLVSVHASPAISGASVVCLGSAITLAGTPSGGTWTVADSSLVSITTSGVVTALAAGVTDIYYSNGGCSAHHPVTVNAAATISGTSLVCVGSTATLTSTPSGGSWISGNTTMATVSSTGLVSALSPGVVVIYYTMGSTTSTCLAQHFVTVRALPLVTGPTATCFGATIHLFGTPTGGIWTEGDSSVATVSASGIVTGVSLGSTTIYYTYGGCPFSQPVVVNDVPTPISGDSVVTVGSTIVLTDGMPGGTWLSGNTALATVDASGVVGAVHAGTVNIYYSTATSASACAVSHTVTVNPLPKTAPPTTGVTPIFTTDGVNVYPNPAGNLLHIDWLQPTTGLANIIITDMAGREVYKSSKNMDGTAVKTQVDLSSLKDGVYLISINCGNVFYSNKLMIQK